MIIIICTAYSILSMTLRYYWFNVWFITLDANLKCSFKIALKVGLLDKTLNKVWWHICFHKYFWNLSSERHNMLTFYVLLCKISNISSSDFVDCGS